MCMRMPVWLGVVVGGGGGGVGAMEPPAATLPAERSAVASTLLAVV